MYPIFHKKLILSSTYNGCINLIYCSRHLLKFWNTFMLFRHIFWQIMPIFHPDSANVNLTILPQPPTLWRASKVNVQNTHSCVCSWQFKSWCFPAFLNIYQTKCNLVQIQIGSAGISWWAWKCPRWNCKATFVFLGCIIPPTVTCPLPDCLEEHCWILFHPCIFKWAKFFWTYASLALLTDVNFTRVVIIYRARWLTCSCSNHQCYPDLSVLNSAFHFFNDLWKYFFAIYQIVAYSRNYFRSFVDD